MRNVRIFAMIPQNDPDHPYVLKSLIKEYVKVICVIFEVILNLRSTSRRKATNTSNLL